MYDVVEENTIPGTKASSCTVSLFEEHKTKDYQLECLVEDKHYFIKSPMYIVLGEPRDQDDHI